MISSRSSPVKNIFVHSLADVGFLFIFFVVSTVAIQTNAGINTLLPPLEDGSGVIRCGGFRNYNVFSIVINKYDQLLLRDRPAQIADIKPQMKRFVSNPDKSPNYAETPKHAIVTLLCDSGTSYDFYIAVYNEIRAAYRELWDEKAQEMFGKPYSNISKEKQSLVRQEIPLVISEAEPTHFELFKN